MQRLQVARRSSGQCRIAERWVRGVSSPPRARVVPRSVELGPRARLPTSQALEKPSASLPKLLYTCRYNRKNTYNTVGTTIYYISYYWSQITFSKHHDLPNLFFLIHFVTTTPAATQAMVPGCTRD